MPKYLNYTENDLKKAVKESKSIAEVLKKLDLIVAGGNYGTIKRKIAKYNIDISHFTGQGWNKENFKSLGSLKSRLAIKANLIRTRGHVCESCKLSEWQGTCIPLEVEHINGLTSDNREENLKLLCANCHALTSTYRRKKSSL